MLLFIFFLLLLLLFDFARTYEPPKHFCGHTLVVGIENDTRIQCNSDRSCDPPYECDTGSGFCCLSPQIKQEEFWGSTTKTFFNSVDDHERMCGVNGQLFREKDNLLVKCQSHSDCLMPSICHTPTGYCCIFQIHRDSNRFEMCPIAEVAYLSLSNGDPLQCTSPMECPPGYYCSSHTGVCCGLAGTCANPTESPHQDDIGRLIPCSPITLDSCPNGSQCKNSISSASGKNTGQHLCCRKNIFSCPISGTPVPSASDPQRCSMKRNKCPIGSTCRPSNIPGTDICCSMLEVPDNNLRYSIYNKNVCPTGWKPPNGFTESCSPTKHTCSGYASCLLSPTLQQQQQFVCCIPGQDRRSTYSRQTILLPQKYSCYPPHNHVELMDGLPKQCHHNPEAECSQGYWCQATRENIAIKICCGPFRNYDYQPYYQSTLLYQCSLSGQTPLADPNFPTRNQFCNSFGIGCNTGNVCQLAAGQTNVYICCALSTSTIRPTNPLCPTGANAQPSATGFVQCTLNQPNTCLSGYVCTQSINIPTVALCCSSGTANQILICPNGQTLFTNNGQAQFCTPNQANTCSAEYTCSESVASPGIFCTINNPNVCPAGTNCLQSSNQPQSYVCCRNTDAPRVCPNNQFASLQANGQLEFCTGPGATCSIASYTCQFSAVLSQFVCCGAQPSVATCADGRETYTQIAGQTFQCPQNTCPVGYDCAPSNANGINVCCITLAPITGNPLGTTFRPPTEELDCPLGWSAFEDSSGAQRYCQSATDMSCPQGFSCAQSSLSGIFLCCRYASPISCTSIFTTLLVNNAPRLCTTSNWNSCPDGYTCQQSNIQQVFICCGSPPGALTCDDGSLPAYIGQNVRFCSRIGYKGVCPQNYVCSPSNQDGLNVCCNYMAKSRALKLYEQSDVHRVCGSNSLSYLSEKGTPISCSSDPTVCPMNFHCQPSMTNTKMYCCQEAKCPGSSFLPETPQTCQRDTECRRGLKCIPSVNIPELKICCHLYGDGYNLHEDDTIVSKNSRCKGRKTALFESNPIHCTINSYNCPNDFTDCSTFTTTGDSICCEDRSDTSLSQHICGDNREPYRNPKTDEPIECDSLTRSCPGDYRCKQTAHLEFPICCSPIAFCPRNKRPQIDSSTNQAKRCFSNRTNSKNCDTGYSCHESSVNDLYVCCEEEPTRKSTNDLFSKIENNDQPKMNIEDNWTVMEGK